MKTRLSVNKCFVHKRAVSVCNFEPAHAKVCIRVNVFAYSISFLQPAFL